MKLLILGATGGIGLEIVRQAVARHHSVTAFVRSPARLAAFQDRISFQQGDLLSTSELERAIQGSDAVLSAFGPRVPVVKADATLLRDFASALTSAMRRVSVRRLVIVSTAFLFRDSILPPAYLVGRLFFPGVVADASQWRGRLRRVAWTGQLFAHPNSRTSLFPGGIACGRGICLLSDSIFPVRTLPTVSSRPLKMGSVSERSLV